MKKNVAYKNTYSMIELTKKKKKTCYDSVSMSLKTVLTGFPNNSTSTGCLCYLFASNYLRPPNIPFY